MHSESAGDTNQPTHPATPAVPPPHHHHHVEPAAAPGTAPACVWQRPEGSSGRASSQRPRRRRQRRRAPARGGTSHRTCEGRRGWGWGGRCACRQGSPAARLNRRRVRACRKARLAWHGGSAGAQKSRGCEAQRASSVTAWLYSPCCTHQGMVSIQAANSSRLQTTINNCAAKRQGGSGGEQLGGGGTGAAAPVGAHRVWQQQRQPTAGSRQLHSCATHGALPPHPSHPQAISTSTSKPPTQPIDQPIDQPIQSTAPARQPQTAAQSA